MGQSSTESPIYIFIHPIYTFIHNNSTDVNPGGWVSPLFGWGDGL